METETGNQHVRSSTGDIVVHRREHWPGFTAELVRRTGLARQEITVTGERHSIFLNLEGTAKSGENFVDGLRTSFTTRPAGSLAYIPPGRTWSGWDDGDDTAAYLFLSVDPDFAGRLFEDPRKAGGLQPELGFHDLAIQFAARKIAAELPRIDQVSGLIVEGYLTTIFGHLSRRVKLNERPMRGGLAPAVLRRTLDRLGAIAEEKISLTGLCQEIGMSTAHFSRAFKQSTGFTPHAYFNQKRLEHATMLLRTTSMPVTEIAFVCGFASASHLSTTFTRALGVSPNVYRSVWGRAVEK